MKATDRNRKCGYLALPDLELPSVNAGSTPSPRSRTQLVNENYVGTTDVTAKHRQSGDQSLTQIDRCHVQLTEPIVPPRTTNEKLMASIWTEILDLRQFSVHENFFDHGRDSFRAIEFVARVRKVFRVKLSVQALFEEPTVAGMTAAVLKSRNKNRHNRRQVERTSTPWTACKRSQGTRSKNK